jgi:hypothetical protein
MENKEQQYIQSLNEIERQSYELAKKHLKGIFYLEENNGFLEWKKKNQLPITQQPVSQTKTA